MELLGGPDAFWLFAYLRRFHHRRGNTGRIFAICPRAMAQAKSIPTLSEHSIRRERDHLIRIDVLIEVHRGGMKPGDPNTYRFARLDQLRPASSSER
jgi:hypothetical protein